MAGFVFRLRPILDQGGLRFGTGSPIGILLVVDTTQLNEMFRKL